MATTSAIPPKNISGDITIRHAEPGDARGIAEAHVSSWRTGYRGIVPDARLEALDAESRVSFWETHLESCFVSVDGDGVVTGFVSAGPAQNDELGADGEIYAIYLVEAAKKQGIGRRLMYESVFSLREAGFRSVCLWLLKDNPAKGFYERFGGRIVGEKPYVTGGFTLPSIGCKWDDIDTLIAALQR
jgi:ribosomal protein S18 acetylase RimI-like enzyme